MANYPKHGLAADQQPRREGSVEAIQRSKQEGLNKEESDLLKTVGGEPLAGSGFESEEPEENFA